MYHSKTNEYKFKLDIVKKKAENKFLQTFFPKNFKKGVSSLQNIQKGYMMGQKQIYLLGLGLGTNISLLVIIVIFLYFQKVTSYSINRR